MGLEFAVANGNEYQLLTSDWAERFARKEPMPSYEYVQKKLAEDLGGVAADYAQLALALVATVHGTAILLLGEGVGAAIAKEFKQACIEACRVLIESGGERFRDARR